VAPIAMLFGVLLSVLGVVLFAMAEPEHRSPTALIPTFFGLALIALGLVARNEKARMHVMHAAALLGLIGLLFPGFMAIKSLIGGAGFTLAVIGQLVMAALCGVFLVLCVKSFIAARRARKQKELG
jgi:uncharacterized membrane protein